MNICIDDRQKRHSINRNGIKKKAQTVLNALESREAELSIVLVDDEEIARLNEAYLHRSGPTNVIAFPMREGLFGDINPQLLGDVVISMDTVAREAKMSGLTTETRFDQLLVHGILHLFGYDHEKNLKDATKMALKEEEMLFLLTVS